MTYDQRPNHARTDTTRHLNKEDVREGSGGVTGYLDNARERSAKFADSTARLREIRAEIDSLGREAHDRPTGVLSGGDFDIAYHYLGVTLGIIATLYSVIGAIFTLHGGSEGLLAVVTQHWDTGPAAALSDAFVNMRTLIAIVIQAVLFVVIVATRRNRHSWQHWAALMASVALTYAGWSTLLLQYGTPPLESFTKVIPAFLLGAGLAWAVARSTFDVTIPRVLLFAFIGAGALAGALGVSALIHWTGLLLAWSADHVARRVMVVG